MRTDDPLVANEVLTQLSYIPTQLEVGPQWRPEDGGRTDRRAAF